jgi:hypothetical protein
VEKLKPIGRGLAQFEWEIKRGEAAYTTVGISSGNGLIPLSVKTTSSYPGASTLLDQTRIEGLTGALFPVAVGNQYKYRIVATSGGKDKVGNQYDCRVAEKRPASQFHRDLAGDAFVIKCQATQYGPNQTNPSPRTVYQIFVVDLGYFLVNVDPTEPNEPFPDKGFEAKLTSVTWTR